ncbi:uncharacterized protein LOC8081094 isoform X1 [Sorghum bicolor]|uniref:FHA domain-containing protein n=1 Tax=Sorghum bicolor TaxID=4558 RepID=A0A1B6QNQ3_SORBI|nr:uncharacterized protein LOC8081094 isoform X1 [Sorghum bicolor]KXG39541.1 hypothetical protein SORBI_3001G398800 [Sorghum bicolor]|eukprot:XP_021306465.1 uncharacterized protein LOC8081094 isoform X1 [Sorghum bicolor]
MGALSASTSSVNWLVEDDILLKNAVEAGASLESLAKGAVCFSRKFTLQEIQDRWNSLLYDPEISTQAASRMAEYENELSTSDPAKAHKLFNSKAKDFSFQKRKIDSVKNLYYAMRKRVRNDPCNSGDLGFLVAPCSCMATGSECVCGGLPNNIEPELNSVSRYGQVGSSYNGGHAYSEMNGQSFHTKHTESMARDGDGTNNVVYGYSDVGQLYEHHAYAANNHGNSEGNNVSLKSITDFQDSMQFQHLDNNQCGNGVVDSKALVIPNHFSGSVQEPTPLQVIGQPEGSEAPDGAIWSGVQQRDRLTLADDKNVKSENRDPLTFEANLDGGMSGLDHAADFMDFPFFSNSEDFDILNSENFLNSPSEGNQEDLDDPAFKVVHGVRSSMQNLVHPDDANISCDQIDLGDVKNNADASGIILVPTPLLVPCPGLYVECKLNTEDPEIPCNDDVSTPTEYPLECCTSTFGQKSENTIYSASPATSPPSNAEQPKTKDLAIIIKSEDMANVQPSLQTIKMNPSTSEQKEDSVAHDEGGVLGAKPSEGASTTGALLTGNIDTNDANTCMLALPSFSAAGFGEGSPCSLGPHESFDNSHGLTLQNSVQAPDQMQHNSLNGQPELGDKAALQNCTPSNALPDLGIQNTIANAATPAQAEECLDHEKDVPNYYDLEALILDQDLIPWDQDSDLMHPEVTRFHHPESRKALIRLEQGARSYMNRAIMSHGAFAVIYGLHLKCYIKDPEVTLGRETEDVKVDIDLGKEGRANKISRRQAVIKMDESGSFHIKNIGKCPIFVNSKEIPSCKRINLNSDSLIEIKDMRFIFHVNQDAVRQYIDRNLKPER